MVKTVTIQSYAALRCCKTERKAKISWSTDNKTITSKYKTIFWRWEVVSKPEARTSDRLRFWTLAPCTSYLFHVYDEDLELAGTSPGVWTRMWASLSHLITNAHIKQNYMLIKDCTAEVSNVKQLQYIVSKIIIKSYHNFC